MEIWGLGRRRDWRVAEGGSRLWPQLYGGGGGWCVSRRGMATDGNVAISGSFPGSSEHLMDNLEMVQRQNTEASVANRASKDCKTEFASAAQLLCRWPAVRQSVTVHCTVGIHYLCAWRQTEESRAREFEGVRR